MIANHGSNSGGGNAFVPVDLEMAAYDRLPLVVRQFLDDMTIKISAVATENRLVQVHKGSIEAWICECEFLFPRFRDGVTAETWGNKDHPSIGGPILESDHGRPVSRRPARRRI